MPSAIALAGLDAATESNFSPKPSITNVISVMDEGFLPGYYSKLVAEHAIDNIESYRYQLGKFGRDIAVGALKAIPNRPNPASAIGDEVHNAIDRMFAEGEVTPDDELSTTTARQMFRQWRHFYETEKPEVVATEYTVWSYKHGYAGTGDLLVKWRGQLWIWDTKTGNRVYPKTAMQCVALAKADVILAPSGEEVPMPEVERLGVLHVRPRSVRLYDLLHPEEAFAAFLGLKSAFDWRRFSKESTIPQRPLAEAQLKAS